MCSRALLSRTRFAKDEKKRTLTLNTPLLRATTLFCLYGPSLPPPSLPPSLSPAGEDVLKKGFESHLVSREPKWWLV